MASRAEEMSLSSVDDTETWLRMMAAKARSKNLLDKDGRNEVTDLFLSTAGITAIRQVTIMAAPRILESMSFNVIQELILSKIRPNKRLIIAERTNFMSMCQEKTENILSFSYRLKDAARNCEFQKIPDTPKQSIEDELIQMRLIAGISSKV